MLKTLAPPRRQRVVIDRAEPNWYPELQWV